MLAETTPAPTPFFTQAAPDLRSLNFRLPQELEAGEPPEARGLERDQVRLMVSHYLDDRIEHTGFRSLPDRLSPGDVLVVNTSKTLNAALPATRSNGEKLELHLSTRLPAGLWVVELRRPTPSGTEPYYSASAGEKLNLPGKGTASLLVPYRSDQRRASQEVDRSVRLWIADIELPEQVETYLDRYGFPIRYNYVREQWPTSYYQTIFADEPGSAEMPAAGRAFTYPLLAALKARGVIVTPVLLHTGVASLEEHEPPYEEYFRVPPATARLANEARAAGKRVIAAGTTTVRALETVTGRDRIISAGQGWTDLVVTQGCCLRSVEGLLTGLHEPRSTHLAMLAALAGFRHLRMAYGEALRQRYLWHEFGDMHLLLP